jgi:dienelactone hydrolase
LRAITSEGHLAGIGFSMGGWAICELSTRVAGLRAVATCYGFAESAPYEQHRAHAYQLHLADFDDYPAEEERAFMQAVKDVGSQIEVFRYPGARHGFINDEHPEDFHQSAASWAWRRIDQFIDHWLGA